MFISPEAQAKRNTEIHYCYEDPPYPITLLPCHASKEQQSRAKGRQAPVGGEKARQIEIFLGSPIFCNKGDMVRFIPCIIAVFQLFQTFSSHYVSCLCSAVCRRKHVRTE
jgi:hypothetical protein